MLYHDLVALVPYVCMLDVFEDLAVQKNQGPDSRLQNKRRSLVPPSSLVLSVALDEVVHDPTPTSGW